MSIEINEQFLFNYAKLMVTKGINMQKGQTVIIETDVECAYFACIVTDAAYEYGAREVVVRYRDDYIIKSRYLKASDEVFDEFSPWQVEFFKNYDDIGSAYIHLLSPNPELLKDADPAKISRATKSRLKNITKHMELTTSNEIRWTICAIPNPTWAKIVFPNLNEADAMAKLWDAVAKASRIDNDDPNAAWDNHGAAFISRVEYLNTKQFDIIKIKNAIGTDVSIKMPENHIWIGGGDVSRDGLKFYPNVPTEEIFSAPHKTGVNGRIVSSLPLIYQGNVIEGIDLTLEDGRIVSYKASKNEDILKSIVETDDGAHYLGEIALVANNSPISNMKILFFDTLFDENASCHFALGRAYPCIEGSEDMSADELAAAGLNHSIIHVDFMFGTPDMEIIGVDKDGTESKIFVNGDFAV